MSEEKAFQQWLMLYNQGLITHEEAVAGVIEAMMPDQLPQIINPTPAVMARMGIPYPIPAADPPRIDPRHAAIWGLDPAMGRDEAVYRIANPQYVGRMPLRRDIPVLESPSIRYADLQIRRFPVLDRAIERQALFQTYEILGVDIHNSAGVANIFVDWTPEPTGMLFPPTQQDMDALKNQMQGMIEERAVLYKALAEQEAELKELRERRDDALTRPIFNRGTPKL